MHLSDGIVGQIYIITEIKLSIDLTRRLEVLGLTHGVSVSILHKKRRGAMIIKFRNTRFAIGRHAAENIIVGGGDE